MKIQDAYLAGAAASQLQKAQEVLPAEHTEKKREAQAAGPADGAQVSDLAARLVEFARAGGPEAAAKIGRLAADFRAGRYQPDPLAVSQRLIQEAFETEP